MEENRGRWTSVSCKLRERVWGILGAFLSSQNFWFSRHLAFVSTEAVDLGGGESSFLLSRDI